MAKVFGLAGDHSARESVVAFRKMLMPVIAIIAALAFVTGVAMTLLLTRVWAVSVAIVAVVLLSVVWWTFRIVESRIEAYERDRLNQRKGALGEWEAASDLEQLSNQFTVFHNVNTPRGNLDHFVIGPTGVFAIETKNWRGLITSDGSGELMQNGPPTDKPVVRAFVRRTMAIREQIVILTQYDDIFIKPVMVFPKATVGANFGPTSQ